MAESTERTVKCTACGRSYRWKAELAGRKVRCQCQAAFVMPAEDPAKAPVEVADMDLAIDDVESARFKQDTTGKAPASCQCPSCNAAVKPEAVICMSCGYNMKEGKKIATQTGGIVRPSTGPRSTNRKVLAPQPAGFFGRISTGWQFAKISYGILWDFKQLILFPILSAIAAILVLASFALPLWATGTLAQWSRFDHGTQGQTHNNPMMYVIAFAFYFCSYFVIVFFNTALTACAMKVTAGESPTIGYGFSVAVKRLPQILAWALVSACIGTILKAIENSHKRAGQIVALILGSAWGIITYFVVPVLCVEGVGPVQSVKRSFSTLKDTWGEGLVGNFSMGLLSFLVTLPIYLILAVCFIISLVSHNPVMVVAVVAVGLLFMILHASASSAADGIFKALLYNFATGRSMPADIDDSVFAAAFGSKGYDT